jgi:hypothetical protein
MRLLLTDRAFQLQTLDQWYAFFSKRYPIVGKLSAEKE